MSNVSELQQLKVFNATAVKEVMEVSTRLEVHGPSGMSNNELAAAAIVNGCLDDLPDHYPDFRTALIYMGREWSHAVIATIFAHKDAQMNLCEDDPGYPIGKQRILPPR